MAHALSTSKLLHLVHIYTADFSNMNFNIILPHIPKSFKWSLLTLIAKFYLTNALWALCFQFLFSFQGERKNFTPTKIYILILTFWKAYKKKIMNWVVAHILRIYFSLISLWTVLFICYCYSKLPELCQYKMGLPAFYFQHKVHGTVIYR